MSAFFFFRMFAASWQIFFAFVFLFQSEVTSLWSLVCFVFKILCSLHTIQSRCTYGKYKDVRRVRVKTKSSADRTLFCCSRRCIIDIFRAGVDAQVSEIREGWKKRLRLEMLEQIIRKPNELWGGSSDGAKQCWGLSHRLDQHALPSNHRCLRQLLSQPAVSLPHTRLIHSAVLSWLCCKPAASNSTLGLLNAAAAPQLPRLTVDQSILLHSASRLFLQSGSILNPVSHRIIRCFIKLLSQVFLLF